MEFASNFAYDYGGYSSNESDDEAEAMDIGQAPAPIPLSQISPAPPPPPPGLNVSPPPMASLTLGNSTSNQFPGAVPQAPPPPSLQLQQQQQQQSMFAPPPPPPAGGNSNRVTFDPSIPAAPPPPAPSSSLFSSNKANKKKSKTRKSDTNVINVKFGCLEESVFTSTALPQKCGGCPAFMSNLEETYNDLNSEKGAGMMWKCSFCGYVNTIADSDAKNPRKGDILYVPENEKLEEEEKKTGKEGEEDKKDKVDLTDDSVLLFTLDISGSMGATVCEKTQVNDAAASDSDGDDVSDGMAVDDSTVNASPTNQRSSFFGLFSRRPRTAAAPGQQQLTSNSGRRRQQNMQPMSQSKNQYLSRLDLTKTALLQRLKDMKTNKPNVKLGVVSFCTDVIYLADGTSGKKQDLNRRHENDKQMIQRTGTSCKLPGPVKESSERLKRAISGMYPQSMTALGPALLMSVAIAGKQNQSKVVICTDGMANVGIGSLNSDQPSDDFYDYVSEYANEFGVSVSVLSIEGADCRLTALGKVADATNGSVNIVSPTDLGSEYSGIISKKIVGSKVEITLVLHSSLYVRDPLSPNDKSKSSYKLNIGNVTSETENFFEFGFKPKESPAPNVDNQQPTSSAGSSENADDNSNNNDEPSVKKEESKDSEPDSPTELPFQLQISYVNKHKAQLSRVITTKLPCTKEREVAEKDADLALMGAHAVQSTAAISKEREYTKAKKAAVSKQNWFSNLQQKRGASYNYSAAETAALSNCNEELDMYRVDLHQQQQQEITLFGGNLSCSDDSDDESKKQAARQKKKQLRMRSQADSSANVMFQNSKMTKASLLSRKK